MGGGLAGQGLAMAARLILVVRHADAGDRAAWDVDDDLRPLSQRGIGQAGRLAARLAPAGPRAVFSSPSLRCLGTVLPTARVARLPVATLDELHEGGSAAAVLGRLALEPAQPMVVCTHGDVIADLLSMIAKAGVRLPSQRAEKASTWTLEMADGVVSSAHYAPPP